MRDEVVRFSGVAGVAGRLHEKECRSTPRRFFDENHVPDLYPHPGQLHVCDGPKQRTRTEQRGTAAGGEYATDVPAGFRAPIRFITAGSVDTSGAAGADDAA